MTRNLVYRFLNALVMMSPQKTTGGFNAFAVYNRDGTFDGEGFGKRYEEFLEGYVWLRDWVTAGADKNKMKSEFPVLGVENTGISIRNFGSGNESDPFEICGTYILLVLSPLKCDSCTQEYSTVQQAESEAFVSLTGILKKITEANLYTYTDSEGNDTEGILTEEMVNYLVDNTIITDVEQQADITITSDFNLIKLSDWGKHKMHGYQVTLTLCICEDVEFEFEYNTALWDKAVTKCKTC